MMDFLLGFFWQGEKQANAPTIVRYALAVILLAVLGALYKLN